MVSESKYRTLIWLVVILIATNISILVSFIIHTKTLTGNEEKQGAVQADSQAERGARQFREILNLNTDQLVQFREINREYNRSAMQITRQLDLLRIDMINELGKQNTDMDKIREINKQFGQLHEKLKNHTADYYLKMKELVNEEQQQKLYEIFKDMVKTDEPSRPPGQGRRWGRAWR